MTKKEQEAQAMLQNIAREIKSKLPEDMGFTLLAYEFGEADDRKMLYVSNSNRKDVMNAMVEFLEKNLDDPKMFGKDV